MSFILPVLLALDYSRVCVCVCYNWADRLVDSKLAALKEQEILTAGSVAGAGRTGMKGRWQGPNIVVCHLLRCAHTCS